MAGQDGARRQGHKKPIHVFLLKTQNAGDFSPASRSCSILSQKKRLPKEPLSEKRFERASLDYDCIIPQNTGFCVMLKSV
jgi:hypothetical protein